MLLPQPPAASPGPQYWLPQVHEAWLDDIERAMLREKFVIMGRYEPCLLGPMMTKLQARFAEAKRRGLIDSCIRIDCERLHTVHGAMAVIRDYLRKAKERSKRPSASANPDSVGNHWPRVAVLMENAGKHSDLGLLLHVAYNEIFESGGWGDDRCRAAFLIQGVTGTWMRDFSPGAKSRWSGTPYLEGPTIPRERRVAEVMRWSESLVPPLRLHDDFLNKIGERPWEQEIAILETILRLTGRPAMLRNSDWEFGETTCWFAKCMGEASLEIEIRYWLVLVGLANLQTQTEQPVAVAVLKEFVANLAGVRMDDRTLLVLLCSSRAGPQVKVVKASVAGKWKNVANMEDPAPLLAAAKVGSPTWLPSQMLAVRRPKQAEFHG